jgi:alkylation response protein AidB-like acyl-CoA dehydrogenase
LDLELSADQEALREGVRALCEGRFPMSRVRELAAVAGVDGALWKELAEAGVFVLRVAEADGGVGLGAADAAVVFEELGRALVPGPVVWTHLAAGPRGRVAGTVVGGVERPAPDGSTHVVVESLDALDALAVLDADGVWAIDSSTLDAEALTWPLDPITPVHRIPALPQGERVGDADAAREWRLAGAVLTAAYQVGMADAVAELTLAYAKERQQFDRPIGSFQVIKHMLADTRVRSEVARAAVYAAAVTLDDPMVGDPARAAASAKLLAGEAAVANAKVATQVHGGMGFTWEVDVHLYLKRAWLLNTVFGTPEQHADAIAAVLPS